MGHKYYEELNLQTQMFCCLYMGRFKYTCPRTPSDKNLALFSKENFILEAGLLLGVAKLSIMQGYFYCVFANGG